MLVQRGLEATGRTVVVRREADGLVFSGFANPVPHPQQDVLDPRQLVLSRAQRVQQVRHDLWLDPTADRLDGPLDDVLDLLAGHARREELRLGDGGRQPQKRLAFAEVFRAHGQHDIHAAGHRSAVVASSISTNARVALRRSARELPSSGVLGPPRSRKRKISSN